MMRVAHILVCHTTDPTKAIRSIAHRADDPWYVFLHSDNPVLEAAIEDLMRERDGNIFAYRTNRGLAKSWNEGLHLAKEAGCAASLLLNDDVHFHPGGYEEFLQTIAVVRTLSQEVAYVTMLGLETGTSAHAGQVLPQQFACCAVLPAAVERIGYFDENFTPAYWEDVDFDRRVKLAGMTVHVHPHVLVEHERSSTRRSMSDREASEVDEAFARNKRYFERKWGEASDWSTPFNDPSLGLKIDFRDRHRPYDRGRVLFGRMFSGLKPSCARASA